MSQFTTSPEQSSQHDDPFHFLKEVEYRASHTDDSEVVVDLSSLTTISSDDLNELIRLQAKLRQQGRTLVLKNACEIITQVFTVTRLDRLFEIRDHEWTL